MDLAAITRRKPTLLHDQASARAEGTLLPFDLAADILLVQVDGGDVSATGTLTLAGNAAADETVTIGFDVYTFKSTLTGAAYEVLIGATASDSIDNLIAAINGDAGEGTTYGTGTKPNRDVTAAPGAGDTMDVTARNPGTASNTVVTQETLATVGSQWGGATLAGGTDFVATIDFEAAVDDLPGNYNGIAAVPLAGGAAVTSVTAPGAWRIDVAGILQFRAPISAYTSGVINVRVVHRSKSQG